MGTTWVQYHRPGTQTTKLRYWSADHGPQFLQLLWEAEERGFFIVQRVDKDKRPIDGCTPFRVHQDEIITVIT